MSYSPPMKNFRRIRNEERMSTEQQGGTPIERDAIEDRFKWKLELIFPDWESWEASFGEIESALPGLAARQSTLADSGAGLLATIEAIHATQRLLEKTFVFASMKSDEDTRIGENTARKGRIGSLAVRMSEAVSWFESELLEIEPDRLKKLVAEEPGLELYAHFFHNIHRSRAHTLTADKEALLAGAGIMSRGASQVFNAFDNADLQFEPVEDENGETVALTKARYYKFLKSPNRRLREDSYVNFMDAYGALKNTLAANMDANVKNHVFFAGARKHQGTLEAALHPDGVPTEVFHSLIDTVSDNIATIHRYTALKKKVLKLDPLREFDLAAPLFPKGEFQFEYDEACAMLLDAFAPLGADYVACLLYTSDAADECPAV